MSGGKALISSQTSLKLNLFGVKIENNFADFSIVVVFFFQNPKIQRVAIANDFNFFRAVLSAVNYGFGERIFDVFLQSSAERSGAVIAVAASFRHQPNSGVVA